MAGENTLNMWSWMIQKALQQLDDEYYEEAFEMARSLLLEPELTVYFRAVCHDILVSDVDSGHADEDAAEAMRLYKIMHEQLPEDEQVRGWYERSQEVLDRIRQIYKEDPPPTSQTITLDYGGKGFINESESGDREAAVTGEVKEDSLEEGEIRENEPAALPKDPAVQPERTTTPPLPPPSTQGPYSSPRLPAPGADDGDAMQVETQSTAIQSSPIKADDAMQLLSSQTHVDPEEGVAGPSTVSAVPKTPAIESPPKGSAAPPTSQSENDKGKGKAGE